ncbi:DsbC family protein [Xenophilus azovorans]|uniref:DsbC family protein n=1 Tax=Xenophilus azovorans TaxID=151755 RepID=UPI0006909B7F|nr:DsbC family protein [Xenophilus azovorans]
MMATTDPRGPQPHCPRRLFAAAVLSALCTGLAPLPSLAAHADETKLLDALRKAHPGTRFTEVSRTDIQGLYEVWMNGNVAYVASANPRYFVFGRLFDTQTMRDITGPKLAQRAPEQEGQLQSDNVSTVPVSLDQLPLADALKTVRGSGQRRIAVFSDPNCVYCKQLEPELAGLDNVTIYTFLVPFQGEARPVSIWCAADRDRAWRQWMLQADASGLDPAARCAHPIARNLDLARRLGVQGTPTLFYADGTRTDGYVGRSVLEARLAAAGQATHAEKQP